jgi:hypothetical protein
MNRIKPSPVAFGSRSLQHFMMFVGALVLAWLSSSVAMAQSVHALELNPAAAQPLQIPQPCERERRTGCPKPAMAEQSFLFPQSWAKELTMEQGWGEEHPRMLADVNGDGRQDIVGFGHDGVWFAPSAYTPSSGSGFTPAFVLANFGYQSAWRVDKHVRTTGDINGDGRDDVVGFGEAGVYRALSTGTGLGPITFVVANFGYDQSWRVEKHVRLLADVNGDGRQDIVAFGTAGVWLALATPSGFFSAPQFVLANFGYDQGWTPSRHLRTTADLNGDGRQDIVGFGEEGVWTALSTGNGFAPPQFVLAEFGIAAEGWRVDRHPRLLVDINGDRKQDIVGFGNDGVWTARSTGDGFEAAQFVLAEFGYNQGWRVNTHPRFVADLNGDSYQDIVGFGEDAVYRALDGPTGFGNMRSVLRDLVANRFPFNSESAAQLAPRFVGDANNDGKQDLIVFDQADIKMVRSTDNAPIPAPPRPTNVRITNKTTSSLTLAWDQSGFNESRYLINYGKSGGSTQTIALSGQATSHNFGSLAENTQYCFTVQGESTYDISPESARVCGRTNSEPPPPPPSTGPFTTSIFLSKQPVVQGFVPFLGKFGPINTGAIISKINFPTQYPAMLLLKPGFSTSACGNPNAVVRVHGDMTADQKKAIWGSATPTISGLQALPILGCSTSSTASLQPVNIIWNQP